LVDADVASGNKNEVEPAKVLAKVPSTAQLQTVGKIKLKEEWCNGLHLITP
jgi:hypothetical protein